MKKATKRAGLAGLVILGALTGVLTLGSHPAGADPKEVYKNNCKKCHGWDGTGDTPQGRKEKAADWTKADFQKKISDDEIVKAILDGKKDGERQMKGLRGKVTEAEAREMIKIVRAFGKSPGPFPGEK